MSTATFGPPSQGGGAGNPSIINPTLPLDSFSNPECNVSQARPYQNGLHQDGDRLTVQGEWVSATLVVIIKKFAENIAPAGLQVG